MILEYFKIIHASFSTSCLDLDNNIMITWTVNENIRYDSILIARNVISNTLEYFLGTHRLSWKWVGRLGWLCYGFFLKNILMLNFQEKTIFASKMQGTNILMQDFHP